MVVTEPPAPPPVSQHRETVNRWISSLGLSEPLSLDEAGAGALQADEDVLILLHVPEDGALCRVCAAVMPAPPPPLRTFWLEKALELNLYGAPLGGCWLAYQPEDDILALCHNLDVAQTSAKDFANVLQNFTLAVRQARYALTPDEETLAELQDEDVQEALDQALDTPVAA